MAKIVFFEGIAAIGKTSAISKTKFWNANPDATLTKHFTDYAEKAPVIGEILNAQQAEATSKSVVSLIDRSPLSNFIDRIVCREYFLFKVLRYSYKVNIPTDLSILEEEAAKMKQMNAEVIIGITSNEEQDVKTIVQRMIDRDNKIYSGFKTETYVMAQNEAFIWLHDELEKRGVNVKKLVVTNKQYLSDALVDNDLATMNE